MQPIFSKSKEQILPNIVYGMQPNAIAHVVVDGKVTVEHGAIKTVSEGKIVADVQNLMDRLDTQLS